MTQGAGELPLIDEHVRLIEAEVGTVWAALLDGFEASRGRPGRRWGASFLGCAHTTANELPLSQAGATTPGFVVAEAIPLERLSLHGRHHFSTYAIEFELDPAASQRTLLKARSLAAFPGLSGRVYRALVIGTGLHVRAVTGMLRAIERRAQEGQPPR